MKNFSNSDSETSAVSFTSSPLKLPTLRSHVGFGVAVRHTRCRTKVLDGLTSILRTPEEDLHGTRGKKKRFGLLV